MSGLPNSAELTVMLAASLQRAATREIMERNTKNIPPYTGRSLQSIKKFEINLKSVASCRWVRQRLQ